MKSYKSKKVKIAVSAVAIMLVVCLLTATMAGCNASEIGVTPTEVFFVGNFQKNVADSDISSLMAEGTTLVGVDTMLSTEGWTLENNPYEVIAGIYALAVTNYNNVTRSSMMIMTDASVVARNAIMGKTANVGIRSTYSIFSDGESTYSQTISGVTVLAGLGSAVESLRSNFGWNIVEYSDKNISANKGKTKAGAQFYGKGNNEEDVMRYIMGANNEKLMSETRAIEITVNSNNGEETEEEFVSQRKYAWSTLDRLTTGDPLEVAGTTYYQGTYGASWATSDFSNPTYFDKSKTTISYDGSIDMYTLNITLLDEYVDTASDFTKGLLVKDTKNYIELTNAKYQKSQAKIEVYGNGLIKSFQKIDTLESTEECKLVVIPGTCKDGGSAENRITYAFSYDKDDCNPLKYIALYWPELGTEAPFKKTKVSTDYMLDLSGYTTFEDYNPVANDLASKYSGIYSLDWSTYR